MERTSTWANIGTEYKGQSLISGIPEEMCFKVEKRPMGYIDNNGSFKVVKGTSTVVNEKGRAYGPVSDNYGIVDNPTALGSLQYIDGLEIKRYGELKNGMQFIIGSLPEVNILGDAFTPYLIFRNSFNGRYPVQACICPLRIVCQNQMNISFKEANNTINIKHTSKIGERIEQAQRILLDTNTYLEALRQNAERLATTHITEAQMVKFMEEAFPLTDKMTDRQKKVIEDKRTAFLTARLANDNANFKGTLWSLVNSMTDFLTHEEAVRKTETGDENKFLSVTFDPRVMGRMWEIANALVA